MKFNRNQLKIFMMLLMTLDHINLFVGGELATSFHALTRCVAVFFAFMLVEGFHYTRNKITYLTRLYGWAAFTAVGNQIVNFLLKDELYAAHNNIFLTLAVSATLLCMIDWIRYSPTLWFSAVLTLISLVIIGAGAFLTEGGYVVIPFTLLTYFTQKNWRLRNLSYLAFSALLLVLFDLSPILASQNAHEFWLNLGYNSSWLFITVIPFLHLYNGEPGKKSPFSKYLFYTYYPLHLWVIAVTAKVLSLGI